MGLTPRAGGDFAATAPQESGFGKLFFHLDNRLSVDFPCDLRASARVFSLVFNYRSDRDLTVLGIGPRGRPRVGVGVPILLKPPPKKFRC